MKGIIILAVTIFLVGVQASFISTIQKELEDIGDSKKVELLRASEERDFGTEVNNDVAVDEIQKIETIDDLLHSLRNYKDMTGCSGNTCEWCVKTVCLQVTFVAETNEFQFCATYKGSNVFCKTVPANDFKYCKKIKIKFVTVNVCLEIKNVNISGGKACMDAKVSVAGVSKTFYNICMGISNLLKPN